MPRHGIGIDISTLAGSEGVVTTIDDFVFESFSAGQMHPILTASRTNLLIYSQDFDNAAWSHNADIAVTSSSELAPNGNLEANLIEYDGSGYSFIRRTINATSTAATLSVFAKKGNWRYLGLRNFQIQGQDHTVFDFDTETFSNTATGQTASFDSLANGWYRIIVTQPSPEAANFAGFAISNSSGGELNTTSGQVANVHLFGAQLEQDGFVSNYIPTSGSTVTVSTTLNDTSNVWDFDSTDIMLEADPEDEGFFEEGSNVVLNGDYEELGSELVTDGNFPTGTTAWTVGSGWNIANGIATASPAGDYLSQASVYDHTTVETYKITYDITVDSGTFRFLILGKTGSGFFGDQTTSGTYTVYFTTTGSSGDGRLFIAHQGGFDGDVNSVSVKQVDPNDRWTLGTGWSIEDGKLVGTSVSTQFAQQSLTLTSGTSYEVTFSITGADTLLNNNSFRYPYDGAVSNINYLPKDSPDGTYTNVFTSTGSSILYLGYIDAGTFTGTIDNVTVREYAIQPLDI